jgi:hypothetical protein
VSSDSGLYHRARLAKELAAEQAAAGYLDDGGREISAEDREEVSEQINAIIARNKIDIQPGTFKYRSQKSGAALPLLMNLLVAGLLAGGLYFLIHIFEQKEESLTTSQTAVESAEGKVIETLKRDALRRLEAKDQEISSIRSRVDALNDEKERLRGSMDEEIARRERELQAELSAQLEAERRKLLDAGFSEQSIETQLAELEAGTREQNRREIELLQQQSDADIAAREATIAGLLAQQDQILIRAQQERSDLEAALAEQETRLQERLEEQRQSISAEQVRAEDRLRSLQEQAEQERMLSEQILSFYAAVRDDLRAARYGEALAGLNQLEQFLGQEAVESVPAIGSRTAVDLFLIDSLRGLITREQSVRQADTPSLVAAADLLNSLSAQVEEAGRREAAGDSEGAAGLYARVLERIPAVATSYAYLENLQDEAVSSRISTLERRLADSERALRGERQRADAAARTAADATAAAEAAARTAAEQTAAGASGRRQGLLDRLSGIDAQFIAFQDSRGGAAGISPTEMRELLQAKLQVRELLASDPVRSENPRLYETMERFYEAFALESLQEGQVRALEDVNTLSRALMDGGEPGDLGAVWDHYTDEASKELLRSFLGALTAMLQ